MCICACGTVCCTLGVNQCGINTIFLTDLNRKSVTLYHLHQRESNSFTVICHTQPTLILSGLCVKLKLPLCVCVKKSHV